MEGWRGWWIVITSQSHPQSPAGQQNSHEVISRMKGEGGRGGGGEGGKAQLVMLQPQTLSIANKISRVEGKGRWVLISLLVSNLIAG